MDHPEITIATPDSPAPEEPLKGAELIRREAALAPDKPGVYRMLGDDGEVLYVGKAKSLKKRVLQYAQGRFHTQRIARMVALTREMVLIRTDTEGEALLLEARLIKALKPRYNVLLRDDKMFAEILVRKDHEAPQVTKHRGAHSIPGDYFGPFASTFAVNNTLDTLQKAFLLRTCTDSVYASRTRPCMLHQIKRCSAPCTGVISLPDYNALASQAHDFLRGKSRKVIERMSAEMMQASDEMDFERAAHLRDRVRALNHVAMSTSVDLNEEEADVFSVFAQGGGACVQVVFYRAGQNWGDRAYFPRVDSEDTEGAILDAFLGQFYQDRQVPRLILVSHDLNEPDLMMEALSLKAGRKVQITRPMRGGKCEIVQHALNNAKAALGRRLAEHSAQSKLLQGVAEAFGLDAPPIRIEVYDNSHLGGTHAVGGMVVAGPEGFMKGQYRKFTIRDLDTKPGDDYAMMAEVFRRRFMRLIKEKDVPEGEKAFGKPDLVLVDGGQGQLDAVLGVMAELAMEDIRIVGVAKGPDRDAGLERFFMPGRLPFMMEPKSPVLYYLQRLRDEAHRYAIGANRHKRDKAISQNPLDDIDGIGARRKRALLAAFGSGREVASARVEELQKVEGISAALAQKIYDFFHGEG
ncbi:excinuclease ABC, C subunit [Asticcacaulis biprosthecium C19]|uniref:UvrABC system protein C n=1 Tax=Asticcacaulis biprosthecium C19 TaxID=715226 RepID=F4QNN3_9CAUL|nr:excinuclease ABC subunit UvrC [Asticcacaulis biprosthecium]EGF90941.1 excinuclease ABC, C subunit [Asticcacaulis biprosthecium C19]